MKMKRLIKASMLLMVAALFAACASEDVAQDKKKENGTEAPKGGVIFAANGPKASAKRLSIDGEEETAGAKTRTILKHTPGQGADAYWKWDDFIWVKDKNGTWQKSTHIELHDGGASAEFTLPGSKSDYTDGCEVRYTGHGSSAFYSTPESATSVGLYKHYDFPTANDYTWAGHIGDCGSGKANNTGNPDKFNFTLAHKPAYLCFLPRCENAALAPNIRLTHIKMTATRCYNNPSSNLVALFDFDGETIGPGTQGGIGSNVIDVDISDFPLTTAANPEANATYVIVRPDKYDFKIEYTIKDPTTNVETVITDIKTGITLDKGVIYDVTANLTVPEVPNVYMWDARQYFFYGYEGTRPFINRGEPGATQGASPGSGNDPRMFRNNPGPSVMPVTAAYSCKDCPNVNELCWYVMRGDPHWEAPRDRGLVYNGHLKAFSNMGGLWLKKKAAILRDNPDVSEQRFSSAYPDLDGTDKDWRTEAHNTIPFTQAVASNGAITNKDDYFFLPALGHYLGGWLYRCGTWGYYWSSTANPLDRYEAYGMSFNDNVGVRVTVSPSHNRAFVYPAITFE